MLVLRTPARKAILLTLILLIVGVLLVFFMVVRGFLAPTNTAPASTSTGSNVDKSTNASAAATASAYMKLVSIGGQPTVKMVSGTTFEADGQIKNVDTFQHDITLKITLLDASGQAAGQRERRRDGQLLHSGNSIAVQLVQRGSGRYQSERKHQRDGG